MFSKRGNWRREYFFGYSLQRELVQRRPVFGARACLYAVALVVLSILSGMTSGTLVGDLINFFGAVVLTLFFFDVLSKGDNPVYPAGWLLLACGMFVLNTALGLCGSLGWWPAEWDYQQTYWAISILRGLCILAFCAFYFDRLDRLLVFVGYNQDLILLALSLSSIVAMLYSESLRIAFELAPLQTLYLWVNGIALLWMASTVIKRCLLVPTDRRIAVLECLLVILYALAHWPLYRAVIQTVHTDLSPMFGFWQTSLLATGAILLLYCSANSFGVLRRPEFSAIYRGPLRVGIFFFNVLVPPFSALVCWLLGRELSPEVAIGYILVCALAMSGRAFLLLQEVQRNEKQLYQMAHIDPLTQLYNHHGLRHHMNLHQGQSGALIYLDVNDFKSINELYGNEMGDKVLKLVARTLKRHLPPSAIVARSGCDDFVVLLGGTGRAAEILAQRIQSQLSGWHDISETRILLSVSVGLCEFQAFGPAVSERAFEALYAAKRTHRKVVVYSSELKPLIAYRQALRETMNLSMSESRLPLRFQPILDLYTRRVVGAEVLARLSEPESPGLLLPSQFMEVINQDGKQLQLTAAVISSLPPQNQLASLDHININFSPVLMSSVRDCTYLISLLAARGYDESNVIIEITEDSDWTQKAMPPGLQYLQERGFRFAIDDYGSGYSNVSRLASMPANYVKIDRSLLQAAEHGNEAPLESSLELAHKMGAATVVEGIAHRDSVQLLKRLGAQYVQGFFFAKPLPLSSLLMFTHQQNQCRA